MYMTAIDLNTFNIQSFVVFYYGCFVLFKDIILLYEKKKI